MAERVRSTLLTLRVSAIPAYRKLAEELGIYQGAPSNSPPFGSAPTFQQQAPYQPQQQHQQQQPWMQQYGGNGYGPPPPMPYGDYNGYTGGMSYGGPPSYPLYTQGGPAYPYYQSSPQPPPFPYGGQSYLAPSPGPGGVGSTSPHLPSAGAPLFSTPSFDGFSPFSPLASPSGPNPYANTFNASSEGGSGGYYCELSTSRVARRRLVADYFAPQPRKRMARCSSASRNHPCPHLTRIHPSHHLGTHSHPSLSSRLLRQSPNRACM